MNVYTLPTMPTGASVWLGVFSWILTPIALLWVSLLLISLVVGLGNQVVEWHHHFILAMGCLGTLAYLVLMWFLVKEPVREMRQGTFSLANMRFATQVPIVLVLVAHWREKWRASIDGASVQLRQAQSQRCVRVLLDAVPDNVVDLRGEALLKALRNILAALDAFGDDERVIEQVGFTAFHAAIYKPVTLGVYGQLLEDYARAFLMLQDRERAEMCRAKLRRYMAEYGDRDPCSSLAFEGLVPEKKEMSATELRLAIGYVLD